jgi:DNA-binding response OmpR family regulator
MIYVADDEENVRVLIQSFLEKEGYGVEAFENGDLLYEAFLAKPCDLAVLDVMMPGNDGFAICTKLRESSGVPIIMLTARDSEEDIVSGITLGSDDYLTKPFSPVVLVMRVKAIFRRIEIEAKALNEGAEENVTDSFSFGDITIKPEKLTVHCKASELSLTNNEFKLMEHLLKFQDRAVTREELLSKVWGYDSAVETRVTDDTVKRIRRKLAIAGSEVFISTIWGHGYKISLKGIDQ